MTMNKHDSLSVIMTKSAGIFVESSRPFDMARLVQAYEGALQGNPYRSELWSRLGDTYKCIGNYVASRVIPTSDAASTDIKLGSLGQGIRS